MLFVALLPFAISSCYNDFYLYGKNTVLLVHLLYASFYSFVNPSRPHSYRDGHTGYSFDRSLSCMTTDIHVFCAFKRFEDQCSPCCFGRLELFSSLRVSSNQGKEKDQEDTWQEMSRSVPHLNQNSCSCPMVFSRRSRGSPNICPRFVLSSF